MSDSKREDLLYLQVFSFFCKRMALTRCEKQRKGEAFTKQRKSKARCRAALERYGAELIGERIELIGNAKD